MDVERKKRLVLGVTVGILVIIAIIGYAFQGEKEPLRAAFDTKGGGVVFDHRLHTSLKDTACSECHHNYEEGKDGSAPMNCRECHYDKGDLETCRDEAVHKRCIGKNCQDCHGEGSASCEFCHNAEHFQRVKSPKTVTFDTDGGRVVFDHFTHASADGYDLSCDTCHHGYKPDKKSSFPMNCRRCHYNKKYSSICEEADAHTRCIGKNCVDCHEDGAENCEICHKE
jgi:hypothetical protein